MNEFKSAVCHAGHFCDSIPPVVMVAADDDFSAGKSSQHLQIGNSILNVHGP